MNFKGNILANQSETGSAGGSVAEPNAQGLMRRVLQESLGLIMGCWANRFSLSEKQIHNAMLGNGRAMDDKTHNVAAVGAVEQRIRKVVIEGY